MTDAPPITLSPEDAAAQIRAGAKAQKAFRMAARPWFKKKRFAFPSAVVIVFLVIMVTTGGSNPSIFDVIVRTPRATTAERASTPSPARATVGQSIRDGKFTFAVRSVQRPSKTLRDQSGTIQTAQGVFVVVRVNVTNVGYDARSLTATDQFLLSVDGQRFGTSPAISVLPGAEAIFVNTVNPGHTVNDAPVLFDVPAGTAVAGIELRASQSSAGVRIRLP